MTVEDLGIVNGCPVTDLSGPHQSQGPNVHGLVVNSSASQLDLGYDSHIESDQTI